jgi:hypothetical protein
MLRRLVLSNNSLQEDGVCKIADALKAGLPALQRLHLANCAIAEGGGGEGALRQLALSVAYHPTLVDIDIKVNFKLK